MLEPEVINKSIPPEVEVAEVKPFVPTVREKFESKVIVLADPEAVKKLSQDPGNAQAKIAMKQDYEKKLDRAASSVETS
jgi:hypothetical protein